MGNKGDKEEKRTLMDAEEQQKTYDKETGSKPLQVRTLDKGKLHEEGPDRRSK